MVPIILPLIEISHPVAFEENYLQSMISQLSCCLGKTKHHSPSTASLYQICHCLSNVTLHLLPVLLSIIQMSSTNFRWAWPECCWERNVLPVVLFVTVLCLHIIEQFLILHCESPRGKSFMEPQSEGDYQRCCSSNIYISKYPNIAPIVDFLTQSSLIKTKVLYK